MTGYDHRVLDTVIHSRIRLAVVALLAAVDDAEFTHIRDQVGTTDGNLGNHLGRLVDAGYVSATRVSHDGQVVTRYALTAPGHDAFQRYLQHLEQLLHPSTDTAASGASPDSDGPTLATSPDRSTP